MHLFLIHCGYYDKGVAAGGSECHANFFVVAASFAAAKAKAKTLPDFKARKMHVDTMQRVDAVDGFRVDLTPAGELQGGSLIVSHNAWARKAPDASV